MIDVLLTTKTKKREESISSTVLEVAMDTGTALMMGPRHGVAELIRQLGGSCQLGALFFVVIQSPKRTWKTPTKTEQNHQSQSWIEMFDMAFGSINFCVAALMGTFTWKHWLKETMDIHGAIDQVHS